MTEELTPYDCPPDPGSALQLKIADVAYLRMLNEASNTIFWLEGYELFLKHFQVERLDIVYDDRECEGSQYIDDGSAMVVFNQMTKDAARVFVRSELEEVRNFFLSVF